MLDIFYSALITHIDQGENYSLGYVTFLDFPLITCFPPRLLPPVPPLTSHMSLCIPLDPPIKINQQTILSPYHLINNSYRQ